MAGRVKYARRASGRVSSYALDSEGDSTDADEAVQTKQRRSTANKGRGKGKRTRDEENDGESTAAEASDESDSPKKKTKPRQKRAKKSNDNGKKKKKQGGKQGKLETIQMLPLEMLGEIFSHVGPNTLLALRLVNKQFHAFLSAKSADTIWKAARRRADLPDIEDMTEMQYAELMFGKTCQGCYGEKVGKICHDFFLRKNLCKRCRRLKIVNVTRLSRDAPEAAARLHPLAVKCVNRSGHSGISRWYQNEDWYRVVCDYANLDDLWLYDRLLRDLDAQDEDSDIAAQREPVDAPQHEMPRPSARSSNRPRRYSASTWQSYKDESESDDGETSRSHMSRRGKAFVNARQGVLERNREASSELLSAFYRASTFLQHEHQEIIASERSARERLNGHQPYWEYTHEIQRRLLEEDPDLDRAIFTSRRWDSAVRRFASGVQIDDEGWSQIKTQAHAACAKIAPKLIVDQLATNRATQSAKLRARYDQLLESLDEGARPFVPLFTDFLLLPSVKELWTPGVPVDDATWAAQLPLIKEELNEYRLELVLHARREILAATTDPATASQEDEDIVEVESLNDAFFQLATSFVCCAFTDCPSQQGSREVWDWRTRSRTTTEDRREGWIGPLVEVLQHQHRFHNSSSRLRAKAAKASYPPFRVSLPLEVACGIEALLELHHLDDSKAKKRHLDEASKHSAGYEWVNSRMSWRYFSGSNALWNLLGWIRRQGAKAAKCQLFLEPPEIRFRRARDDKLVIDVNDTEDEKAVGPDTKKAASSKSGHAAGRVSGDEEAEEEDSEDGEDSREHDDDDDDEEEEEEEEDDDEDEGEN